MAESKQSADFLSRLKARHNAGPPPPPPSGQSAPSRYTSPALPPRAGAGEARLPPPPNGGFLSTSLSNRNLQSSGPAKPRIAAGAGAGGAVGAVGAVGNLRIPGGPMGGRRPPKRVYPLSAKGYGGTDSATGHVGGFAGSGHGCRPSGGALLCFLVGFVMIIVSVVITAYAILSNEKNSFGMAIASNQTVFYRHISQTQPGASATIPQARVGIHNADPQATLEVTTHGSPEDAGTTLRLSRLLTQDQADGDIERAMKSRLEFGFYAVDGQGGNGERSWVQGAQVSSDVHTGSLYMTSGVGSLLAASSQNRTQRRRVLGDDETARPAEEGIGESSSAIAGGRLDDADVWDDVDAGHLSSAVAALRRGIKMRGSTAASSTSSEASSSSADQSYEKIVAPRRQRRRRRQLAASSRCEEGSLFLNAEAGACGDVSIAAGGGNVGIGVKAPAFPLDIAGNVYSSGTIKMGGSIQLGKMTITNGTTAAGLQACEVPGEVRYTTDEFYGCTKDRGWVPLTATFHSQYNGTLGQMAYFVGPTGQTGSTGIHWKDKYQEFRLQSQHESEPTTKVSAWSSRFSQDHRTTNGGASAALSSSRNLIFRTHTPTHAFYSFL